ncbi:bifunctional DNA primase/polymerase [Streptomyces sp. YS415]|uniref:bifunctional DNA primase/polymerase n=1 Tax=Streptomyces sp. YS415 TaxID=2944806 RepID=UPI0020224A5D|nr:bifunctional DNA primase/polymerase [Streptomyces sp. YS415]MCL7430340.1 bifunctional DNA primase/polymerase [Streptomyces sp. YS415]
MARWCAEQGWPVHPLATGRKTPAANCPACKDKHHAPSGCPCIPAGRPCHGFHAATTSTTRLDGWWSDHPSWGVGAACGEADLIVIDIGAHAVPVPDRSRLLPGTAIQDSANRDGLASGLLSAPLPEWLREELIRTRHTIQRPPASSRPTIPRSRRPRKPVRAHRVLDPLLLEVTDCAAPPEGTAFTEKLNKATYTAGGLAAAGHLDEHTARALLREAADTARPWQRARNERIIDDALAAGSARPLHLEGRS